MNYLLTQAPLIVDIGDEESTFWTKILVILLLVVSWGLYSLVKNKQKESKDQTSTYHTEPRWQFRLPRKHIALYKDIAQKYITKAQDVRAHIPNPLQKPIHDFNSADIASQQKLENELPAENSRDLSSGLELLELDFLLNVVENTKSNNHNDATMRKLSFNELLRRNKLNQVNSKALKIYAINYHNLYGKDIQCEAIAQLAERTTRKTEHSHPQPALAASM